MEELFRHIEIGGVEQYILVRGNKDKPILLFIHGGPGLLIVGTYINISSL